MSTTAEPRLSETLSQSWLAARWGIDPARIEAMRRARELIAVREPGSGDWRYPAWQFENGRPRRGVERIVATAREARIDEARLYELLTTPLGLGRGERRRLCDLLREGRVEDVVAAIRAAGR